jgi:hypothetical protein
LFHTFIFSLLLRAAIAACAPTLPTLPDQWKSTFILATDPTHDVTQSQAYTFWEGSDWARRVYLANADDDDLTVLWEGSFQWWQAKLDAIHDVIVSNTCERLRPDSLLTWPQNYFQFGTYKGTATRQGRACEVWNLPLENPYIPKCDAYFERSTRYPVEFDCHDTRSIVFLEFSADFDTDELIPDMSCPYNPFDAPM